MLRPIVFKNLTITTLQKLEFIYKKLDPKNVYLGFEVDFFSNFPNHCFLRKLKFKYLRKNFSLKRILNLNAEQFDFDLFDCLS